MSMDWTPLYERYRGQWVALDRDEQTVLGAGVTAREALSAAQKQGFPQPILTRVPETLTAYVGAGV